MQNSALIGDPPLDHQDRGMIVWEAPAPDPSPNHTSAPSDHALPSLARDFHEPVQAQDEGAGEREADQPPAKRRKVADGPHRPSPRPISPPWKRVTAEGPTSFVENGRRRSGRTNAVPLELQPHSTKRQTRAAFDKVKDERQKHAKPDYNSSTRKLKAEVQAPQVPFKRGPGRPPKHRAPDAPVPKAAVSDKETRSRSAVPSMPLRRAPARQSAPTCRERHSPPRVPNGDRAEVSPQQNGYFDLDLDTSDTPLSSPDSQLSSIMPSPPATIQRVKLRVRLPDPTIATPANIPLPKKYASFEEFLELDESEPRLGEDILTDQQVAKEASARHRVRQARRRGGILDKKLADAIPDKQAEPKRQYAHHDHFLTHISHFRNLLRGERRDHKRKAEILAHEAKRYVEEKQKRNKVKTAEEIEQEERGATLAYYRTVVKDLDKLWMAVKAEVEVMRQKQYEEQQQAKMKGHLARVLDRTDQMLSRSLELDESLANSSEEDTTDTESDNSELMSGSGTDSDSQSDVDNNDAEMSIEELRRKYENLPDFAPATQSEAPSVAATGGTEDGGGSEMEDESDPETEMDSEMDMTSSGEDADGTDDDGDDDDDEPRGGLLSLFSKSEIAEMVPEQDSPSDSGLDPEDGDLPPDREADDQEMADVDESEMKRGSTAELEPPPAAPATRESIETETKDKTTPVNLHLARLASEDPASQEPSAQTSPHTTATKVSEPESVSSIDAGVDSVIPVTPTYAKATTVKTPVPSLLRGTLREYQHEGLDWLADLYANGRSGILADEMGLGKTIQSIALLAHLAEVHEVWGPHLIVVPTSVMLNWEMEFKKFLPGFKILTYYGNLDERKQKRKGWMADDIFNVCITSYQLVLQDANSFKRRRWHYMILDEAHNIKNFRSERWQTMMTFNTRARLLLTGTPLQNNLTELWSLLFFLHYGQESEGEDDAFAGLQEWSEWFRRPVESILEHGRQVLDEEDREQVAKLHKVIRPFLLRRLKADVEKQMPLKYEHVELCRLSKRQRQLYDGFMARAQTKETLASGNYLSIINALMQLRKVCNHPDLFETRPINTSFAMPRSTAADFEIKDLLVRRRLMLDAADELDLDFLQLAPISNESVSMIEAAETTKRHAYRQFQALRDAQNRRTRHDSGWHGEDRAGVLGSLENVGRKARLQDIDRTMYYEAYRHNQRPVYGRGLIETLTVHTPYRQLTGTSPSPALRKARDKQSPLPLLAIVHSVASRAEQMEPMIQHFGCVTPAVVATDLYASSLTERGVATIRQSQAATNPDPFHHARLKLSIAFPDKRLLQYDCGKLQRLDRLLRELQAGGHRALIFTQMTKVLDILEQFLNIHGHRYLRLDGATKVEQRQILTDRFNSDTRILAFILSSRSGGLGINLTGADTVIFYDLDWNPAMDKQCTDRAHRIGQTRDVHIYRFVSEHTIESNILRKANQKQMLDDVVIQEGEFTTDYLNKLSYRDMLEDTAEEDAAGLAMDRILRNDKSTLGGLEQAEDQEDRAAAKVAARELQHADDGDFEDKTTSATPRTNEAQTPGPFGATETAMAEAYADGHELTHIDEYLVQLQLYLMRDIPLGAGKDKRKKGKKKRDEHRVRRAR